MNNKSFNLKHIDKYSVLIESYSQRCAFPLKKRR